MFDNIIIDYDISWMKFIQGNMAYEVFIYNSNITVTIFEEDEYINKITIGIGEFDKFEQYIFYQSYYDHKKVIEFGNYIVEKYKRISK